MKLRRVSVVLAVGSTLAACGLDITGTGISGDVTPGADAGQDAPLADDRSTTAPDVVTNDGDASVDAGADGTVDAAPTIDAAGLPDATTVATGVTDLRSIAVSMDGKDLYVATAGKMMHYDLTAAAQPPAIVGETNDDIRAVAWAEELKAVVWVGNTFIGRYDPPTTPAGPLTSDTHSNEGAGTDIAWIGGGAKKMVATYTTKVTAYNPAPQQITDIHECATGTNGAPNGVVADQNNVYWADTQLGSVGKTNLGGGATNKFVSGLDAPTSVALDGGKLYIAERTSIVSVQANDGSGLTTLTSGLATPTSLYSGGGNLFWLEANGTFVMQPLAPAGSKARIIGAGSAFVTTAHQHLIATSMNAIFWGNPTDGTVKRLQQ